MHEISVLKRAVDLAEKTAKENHVQKLAYLTLEVGELTGYLPVFFYKYYPIVTENNPIFEGSELKIITTTGEALCKDCGSLYNVMREEGKCPTCGSRNKTILGGTEFKLLEIGVSDGSGQG